MPSIGPRSSAMNFTIPFWTRFGSRPTKLICGRPPRARVFEAVWAFWSGAVICPALSRGVWPLALMEFAGRVPIE